MDWCSFRCVTVVHIYYNSEANFCDYLALAWDFLCCLVHNMNPVLTSHEKKEGANFDCTREYVRQDG